MIAVLEYGELPELVRAADALRSLGREIVFFFVKPGYRRLARDGALVAGKGFRWLDAEGRPAGASDPVATTSETSTAERLPPSAATKPADREPRLAVAPQIAPRRPGSVAVWSRIALAPVEATLSGAIGGLRAAAVDIVNLRADLMRFAARNRTMHRIVARERPSLLVLGQTAVGSELDMVLAAAERIGCPSLLVPFAMFNLQELVEFALRRPEHHVAGRPLNRVLASRYPRWVAEAGGSRLVRLPGPRGLALELAGLVVGHPWVPCSGPVTAIACESDVAARQLAGMGLTQSRLHVVGGPVHDRLASHAAEGSAGRRRLASELGLDGDRPILLCGWPANIFAWLGNRAIAYPDYQALARSWTTVLSRVRAAFGLDVVISVHPKTLDEELAAPRAAGFSVVQGETERLVAHCDYFCTLNGSSITAWAIACAKPTVLFDCYDTRYPEFVSVPGVVMTRTEVEFEAALSRVCGDSGYRAQQAAELAHVAANWGRLDGKADLRLMTLARELLGERVAHPTVEAPALA